MCLRCNTHSWILHALYTLQPGTSAELQEGFAYITLEQNPEINYSDLGWINEFTKVWMWLPDHFSHLAFPAVYKHDYSLSTSSVKLHI